MVRMRMLMHATRDGLCSQRQEELVRPEQTLSEIPRFLRWFGAAPKLQH